MFKYIDSQGFSDTASWLIIYDESWDDIRLHLSGDVDNFNLLKSYNYLLTSHHEMVHFWQAISTNFLFYYSEQNLDLCIDTLKIISETPNSSFDILRSVFHDLLWSLTLESSQIRTIDIIEGAAVLCSYRMTEQNVSHLGFIEHLNKYHAGQRVYISAYYYLYELIGDLSFDLFSPVCYLALHFKEPNKAFIDIIKLLSDFSYLHLSKKGNSSSIIRNSIQYDPLNFLIQTTGMSIEKLFLPLIKTRQLEISHPILRPYALQASEMENIEDFFARPYHYFGVGQRTKTPTFVRQLAPPLQLHNDGRANIMGIGKNLGVDWSLQIFYLTAMVGLIGKLIFGVKGKMICPHSNCPIFKTQTCNKFYNFPLDSYIKCSFPKFLHEIKLDKLLTLEC